MQTGVCFTVISAHNNNIPQNTKHFFASLPAGNRVGSSPAAQCEWNLRHFQFFSLWSKLHSAYLILRCITITIRLCWVWKTALFFCRACEIMQTLLQSSSRSVALRACWVQIAHTSTVLLAASLGETDQKRSLPHQHSQSTVPAIEWLPLFSLPLLIIFFLPPALGCVWFTPVLLSIAALFCCWASSHSSPVSKQTGGRERVQGRGWVRGRDKTRLLLLVTQTWLRANTSTMFVPPHSLPPTEWLTLPLALPPSLFPSKSVLCLHSLSQSCYFGWKRQWFGLMELCFLLILLYLAQWEGGWWELLSGFKSRVVEGEGRSVLFGGGWERRHFAGVAHRLL